MKRAHLTSDTQIKKMTSTLLFIFTALTLVNLLSFVERRSEPERVMRALEEIVEYSKAPLGEVSQKISDENYPVSVYYVSSNKEVININNFSSQDIDRLPLKLSSKPIIFNLGQERYLISLQETELDFKILLLYDLRGHNPLRLFTILEFALLFTLLLAVLLLKLSRERLDYIRERKLREEELFLVNSLSHELKTPLSVIMGYSESLSLGASKKSQEYYGKKILAQSAKLQESINKLLDISSLNLSTYKPESKVRISAVITQILEGNEEAQRRFTHKLSEDFEVESELFTFILSNVLSNFFKHDKSHDKLLLKAVMESSEKIVYLLPEGSSLEFDSITNLLFEHRSNGLGLRIIDIAARKAGYKVEVSSDFGYKITL